MPRPRWSPPGCAAPRPRPTGRSPSPPCARRLACRNWNPNRKRNEKSRLLFSGTRAKGADKSKGRLMRAMQTFQRCSRRRVSVLECASPFHFLHASGGREQRASGSPSPPLEGRGGERRPVTVLDAAVRGDIPAGCRTNISGVLVQNDDHPPSPPPPPPPRR